MGERRFALMLENYRANWYGQRQLAGRTADIVDISPFNAIDGAHGPAKRLWIDSETGLTLRVETYNYQLQQVMSSTLSDLNLSPRISAVTFPAVPDTPDVAKTDPWMAQDLGNDSASVVRLTHLQPPRARELPPGFHIESVGVHRCAEAANAPTAALTRYTDGLNTLTIFALKPTTETQNIAASAESKQPGQEDSGVQTCDFGPGTMVMSNRDGQRLIAVGDLPPQTLYRVLGVQSPVGALAGAGMSPHDTNVSGRSAAAPLQPIASQAAAAQTAAQPVVAHRITAH
jgi:negative regulator of sigma E activity